MYSEHSSFYAYFRRHVVNAAPLIGRIPEKAGFIRRFLMNLPAAERPNKFTAASEKRRVFARFLPLKLRRTFGLRTEGSRQPIHRGFLRAFLRLRHHNRAGSPVFSAFFNNGDRDGRAIQETVRESLLTNF
jgi:hypothetical protein